MKSLSRFVIAQIFTLSALLLPFTASAQVQTEPKPSKPTQDPTVQQVLAGVRASIASTIATLPNVECQEQAHSTYLHNGKVKQDVTLNATLQARRRDEKSDNFSEERTPAPGGSVDGKPLKPGKKYSIPFGVNNGFGTTYGWVLSPKNESCWTYKIIPGTAAEAKWIGLQVTPKGMDTQHCGRPSSGKVETFWLDPASYQIRRFDILEPQAMLNQVKKIFIHLYSTSDKPYYVVGKTDYSLVSLGQKSYLLPENVRATAWLKELNSPDELVYDAKYSDCHIFRSSVRIIAQPTSVTP